MIRWILAATLYRLEVMVIQSVELVVSDWLLLTLHGLWEGHGTIFSAHVHSRHPHTLCSRPMHRVLFDGHLCILPILHSEEIRLCIESAIRHWVVTLFQTF